MIRIIYTLAFRALLASATFFCHGCSDAQMAGGAGASQSSKKRPITRIGAPEPVDGKVTGPALSNCLKGSATANAGQTLDLELLGFGAASKVTVQDNIGTATISGTVLKYTAPSSQSESRDVLLTVTDGANTKTCTIKIVGTGKILIPDDGKSKGLIANIYRLDHVPGAKDQEVYNLPDLNSLKALDGRYMSPMVNVPATLWSKGFPTAPDLVEWFAIKFTGKIAIPSDGDYSFDFEILDDGAKLYIDDRLVLDWDHLAWGDVVTARKSQKIALTKGSHSFRVDYFQGPREYLGVVLRWQKPGDPSFTIIPASNFDRPDL